jgi:predicted Zn finger-like uncharacterized protein
MSGRKYIQWDISPVIMQVTCPNCRARYAVDPLAIGPGGRTVQCARCSHRWFETMRVSDNPAPSAPTKPIAQEQEGPQPAYTAGLPAVIAPRPPAHWGRWIAALAALVLLAGAAVFAYRDELQNRLPTEWRTILGFGKPPKAADKPRLELDLAASKVELVDDHYVVRGEVLNAGRAAGSTTALKLVFRKGDDVLDERVYPFVEGPIAPGQRLSFSRQLDEPPDGTTNVVPIVE